MLYSRHLELYEQYLTALLQLYERHCPCFCARLALASMEQDFDHLINSSIGTQHGVSLAILPIVHPRQRDDLAELIEIHIPWSSVHPLLGSILAPRVPQICLETTLSFLRYLRSDGHSVKTRKSLKPLLKSSYFTRLKMRPWLSRVRKRQHHHSNGHKLLGGARLRSAWWGNYPFRPYNDHIPLCFFSYRSEYVTNYDLCYTYRYALRLLPIFLAKAPPDSQLASIAADCTFNLFCTAYPRDTRKARGSIKQYLSRCRSIRTMLSMEKSAVHGMNTMNVD